MSAGGTTRSLRFSSTSVGKSGPTVVRMLTRNGNANEAHALDSSVAFTLTSKYSDKNHRYDLHLPRALSTAPSSVGITSAILSPVPVARVEQFRV